jgi:glycerol uptake facilitator protein
MVGTVTSVSKTAQALWQRIPAVFCRFVTRPDPLNGGLAESRGQTTIGARAAVDLLVAMHHWLDGPFQATQRVPAPRHRSYNVEVVDDQMYVEIRKAITMSAWAGEFIGTAVLILLGDGVVANVLLKNTKGHGSGWIVITFGWSMAVFTGVLVASAASGGHLNPAVSVGLAVAGKFEWHLVPGYVAAQMLGACAGASVVWLQYKAHFQTTDDRNAKLAVFCTGPAIRSVGLNLFSEAVGTSVLTFAALRMSSPAGGLGALDALPVALVVLAIGLSLGGTTGYAINPARDLGPRIMHALLPISDKRDSDWSYAWVPVVGPIGGAAIAALLYRAVV